MIVAMIYMEGNSVIPYDTYVPLSSQHHLYEKPGFFLVLKIEKALLPQINQRKTLAFMLWTSENVKMVTILSFGGHSDVYSQIPNKDIFPCAHKGKVQESSSLSTCLSYHWLHYSLSFKLPFSWFLQLFRLSSIVFIFISCLKSFLEVSSC